MGGTMRAPLTATMFEVELTGDFAARCLGAHRLLDQLYGIRMIEAAEGGP